MVKEVVVVVGELIILEQVGVVVEQVVQEE